MSHGNSRWLDGLPFDIRKKVRTNVTVKINGRMLSSGNWWLRQAPSTGPAKDADLILKSRSGQVISTEPVMRDGKPVGRYV
jgi:hypothetical protein